MPSVFVSGQKVKELLSPLRCIVVNVQIILSVQSCLQKRALRGQKGDSQYCCALVMPLLICSYVTNITMFQDPSRRNEGMNPL